MNLGTLGYMLSGHKFYWFMKSQFKKFEFFTVCWQFMTFSMIIHNDDAVDVDDADDTVDADDAGCWLA